MNNDTVYISNVSSKIINNKTVTVDFDPSLFKPGDEIRIGDSEINLNVIKVFDNYMECATNNAGIFKVRYGYSIKI